MVQQAPVPAKKSNSTRNVIIVVVVVLVICCACLVIALGWGCGDLLTGASSSCRFI
jgi:flagellar basal body-associated protein FliL